MLLKERRLLLSTLGADSLEADLLEPGHKEGSSLHLPLFLLQGKLFLWNPPFRHIPDDLPLQVQPKDFLRVSGAARHRRSTSLATLFLWSASCRLAARIGFWSAFWDSSYTPTTSTTPHPPYTKGLGIYNLFSTQSLFHWYLEDRVPTE